MKNLTAMIVCAFCITMGDHAIAGKYAESLCPSNTCDVKVEFKKSNRTRAKLIFNEFKHKSARRVEYNLDMQGKAFLVTPEEFKIIQKYRLRQAQGLIVSR